MGPWTLLYSAGPASVDVVFVGSFATEEEAVAYAITAGDPWNYQVVQGWGPAVPPPLPPSIPSPYAPMTVPLNTWLAMAGMPTSNGGVKLIAYVGWSSKEAAIYWANTVGTASSFLYGQVIGVP